MLDVDHFAPFESEFAGRDFSLPEVSQEANFLWSQDQQGVTSTLISTGSTSDTVDVLLQHRGYTVLRLCLLGTVELLIKACYKPDTFLPLPFLKHITISLSDYKDLLAPNYKRHRIFRQNI